MSGFGYELTFKLPKRSDSPPLWAFAFLEAIGKSVWDGAKLGPGHTIKTGPLDGRASTREISVLVAPRLFLSTDTSFRSGENASVRAGRWGDGAPKRPPAMASRANIGTIGLS